MKCECGGRLIRVQEASSNYYECVRCHAYCPVIENENKNGQPPQPSGEEWKMENKIMSFASTLLGSNKCSLPFDSKLKIVGFVKQLLAQQKEEMIKRCETCQTGRDVSAKYSEEVR